MNHSDLKTEYSIEEKRFLKISFITICSLFLLILAGGIVRSTGSGMGCPDWPKCFDQWVPPLEESELPANYKEKYVEKRVKKNERFATYLEIIGFKHRAYEVRNDKSILQAETFNVFNTYTEYVNRLIGALTGVFMIIMTLFAFLIRKRNKSVFLICILSLILVVFQGWLGSIVVSTNLISWTITLHMVFALIIIGLVIYAYALVKFKNLTAIKLSVRKLRIASLLGWTCLALTTMQVIWGTEVRELIDAVARKSNYMNREMWVRMIGFEFKLHRTFSILVLFVNAFFVWYIHKSIASVSLLKKMASVNIALILLQIITGIVLAYCTLPPAFQVGHLWVSSLITGVQVLIIVLINMYKRTVAVQLIS